MLNVASLVSSQRRSVTTPSLRTCSDTVLPPTCNRNVTFGCQASKTCWQNAAGNQAGILMSHSTRRRGPAAACTAGSVYLTGTIVRLYFSRQLCNQPTHRPVEAENGWPAPLCDCALRRARCLHFKSSHTWRLIRPFMSLSSRGSIDLYSLPTAHGAKSARK